MRGAFRATVLLVGLAFAVTGFGWFARSVLRLDCVGPVLPAWGCLAIPYPDSLPDDFRRPEAGAVVVLAWLACRAVADVALDGAAAAARRLFPGWLGSGRAAATSARSYRIR
jgi:hypothetical protein